MNISTTSFKKVIKNVFYDKEIIKYSTPTSKEADGWTKKSGSTVTDGTFMANVHFDMKDKVQELYGIKDEIDIVISTDENVAGETVIGYNGIQYKVFRAIPNDTHYLLVAKKWSSRSSTSISA